MIPKYPSLWDIYGPKPRRGRPPGRPTKIRARDLAIFSVYWKVALAHPKWSISSQCVETHKRLTRLKGFEALPKPRTIRRIITELRTQLGIKRSD
jgi:hypothetical protein